MFSCMAFISPTLLAVERTIKVFIVKSLSDEAFIGSSHLNTMSGFQGGVLICLVHLVVSKDLIRSLMSGSLERSISLSAD